MNKLYVVQQTKRHVIARFTSTTAPAIYDSVFFGTYGTPGGGSTALNFPNSIAIDNSSNLFICDHENSRIIKLDSNLQYISYYDTNNTIGKPINIIFDSTTGDLYFMGLRYFSIQTHASPTIIDDLYMYIGIERLTTSLTSVKYSNDIFGYINRLIPNDMRFKPVGICRGSNSDEFLVSGIHDALYSITEYSSTFSDIYNPTIKTIINNFTAKRYVGLIRYNTLLFLNTGNKIIKVDLATLNLNCQSNYIAKTLYGLKLGSNNTLLVYNTDNNSLIRYDLNLNFVEEVFIDISTGTAPIGVDLKFVTDYLEV